jgi:hypothetical protein
VKGGDHSLKREWAAVDVLLSQMGDLPEPERKIQTFMGGDHTRLGSLPERTEEDTMPPQELSAEDKWQQGYRNLPAAAADGFAWAHCFSGRRFLLPRMGPLHSQKLLPMASLKPIAFLGGAVCSIGRAHGILSSCRR